MAFILSANRAKDRGVSLILESLFTPVKGMVQVFNSVMQVTDKSFLLSASNIFLLPVCHINQDRLSYASMTNSLKLSVV